MPLNEKDIRRILGLVAATRDEELDCEECFAHIAQFVEKQLAERELAGPSLNPGPDAVQEAVQQHLAVCPECRDFYEALEQSLIDSDDAQ